MYKWRLLLLASLAVFQPIASFTERNLVDGRQECCDRRPNSLQRDTRLAVYGTSRLNKLEFEEQRLNYRQELPKSIRYAESNDDFGLNSASRRYTVPRERDTRRITSRLSDRFSSGEQRLTRKSVPNNRNRQILYERLTRNVNENDRDSRIHRKTDRSYEDKIQSRLVISRQSRDSFDRSRNIKEISEIRDMLEQTRVEVVRTDSARNEPRISRDAKERHHFESRLQMNDNYNTVRRQTFERSTRHVDDNSRRSSSLSRMLDSTRRSAMDSRIGNPTIRTDKRSVRIVAEYERRASEARNDARIPNNNYMQHTRFLDQNAKGVESRKTDRDISRSRQIYREIRENRQVENYVLREERRNTILRERESRAFNVNTEYNRRNSERRNPKENISYSKSILPEIRKSESETRLEITDDRSFLDRRSRINHNRRSEDTTNFGRYNFENIRNEKRNVDHRARKQVNNVRRETRSEDRSLSEINERRQIRYAVRGEEFNNDMRERTRDVDTDMDRSRNINRHQRFSERQERDSNRHVRDILLDQSQINTDHRVSRGNNKIERVNTERYATRSRLVFSRQPDDTHNNKRERYSNNIDENRRSVEDNRRVRSFTAPRLNLRNEAKHENNNRVRNVNQYIERPGRNMERRTSRDFEASYETRERTMRLTNSRETRIEKNTQRRLFETRDGEVIRNRDKFLNDMAISNPEYKNLREHSRINVEDRKSNTVFGDRVLANENRFAETARHREDLTSFIRNKSEPEYKAPILSWQYLFYSLQGIYLCTIIMQMLSENKIGAKKVSWWNSSFKAPVKVD